MAINSSVISTHQDGSGSEKKKPLLLFTSFPADGHFNPVFMIATYLSKRGYGVAFLTSPMFKAKVEGINAEYIPLEDPFTKTAIEALMASVQLPFGVERLAAEFNSLMLTALPIRVQQLEDALVELRARDPTRQIIFFEDVINWNMYTFKHGRPLPKGFDELPKSIGVGVSPLLMDSIDTAPTLLGLPPDSSPEGRLRNAAMLKEFQEGPLKILTDTWMDGVAKAGASNLAGPRDKGVFNSWYTVHDVVLQLCSPSMEYPRSDLASHIECIGVLPGDGLKPDLEYPSWWPEITNSKSEGKEKRVVFVTQGTTSPDISELILPTLNATAGRDDIILVVTLGVRNSSLPEGIPVPSNVRVLDYFPYDAVLEHADVLVTNAGYGGVGHAVRNAVPIVVAGEGQEKMEVAGRVAWSGMGVNLKTQRPTAEQVRDGIDQILGDSRFKEAAIRLKEENGRLDAFAAVERKVKELSQ